MADHHDISIRALGCHDLDLFRTMRLRALKMHPGYYGENFQDVENCPDEYWLKILNDVDKQVFGLFEGLKHVGITSVHTWPDDPSGKTGFLGMSFIEPDYRGNGYSCLFYKARINFALGHEQWTKLHTNHREGNHASRAAMIKHGFHYVGWRQSDFPDSTRDTLHDYEIYLVMLRKKRMA
ncbi:MAG: GNAT family N-acetyltransferase [Alphaproteobacteria bacterium]